MKSPLLVLFYLLPFTFIASQARAEWSYRFDGGAFSGKIARTQSGNTVPFNAPVGTYAQMEYEYGGAKWRGLVGGSYFDYAGRTASAGGVVTQQSLNYGDARLGLAFLSKFMEYRLLYMQFVTPYTDAPNVNSLNPLTTSVGYLRAEVIFNAKASPYNLQLDYFFNQALTPVTTVNGDGTSNYFLGGCARIFLGDTVRFGPSVCVDLQELYLPASTVVFRQEVSGRFTLEF